MNIIDRNLTNHEMTKTSFVLLYNVENLNNDDYKTLDGITQASLIKTAEERARKLFGAKYARVEYKNLFYAIKYLLKDTIEEEDKVMVLSEECGGYSEFNNLPYKLVKFHLDTNNRIDYECIEELVKDEKPKVLFVGAKFTEHTENYLLLNKICKENGVLLYSIISPSAALSATGVTQNPVFWCDAVVVSMLGSLRGKEGALIITNNKDIYTNLLTRNADCDYLIYNTTVLKEAANPKFSIYGRKCLANAKALAETFIKLHMNVSPTENNIVILEVKDSENALMLLRLKGYDASTFGKKYVIFDSSYLTTLGYKPNDFQEFARRIVETIK